MHHQHHAPDTISDDINTRNSGASWRFGHSPAGGASEPDPAPGVAGPVRCQGAPDGKAVTEGGPQPGKVKGRARLRDRKQRPAHSVRLNERELAVIQAAADAVGKTVAGFLAHSALAAARDQTRTAATIATEQEVLSELFAVRRQLGWAGSNVNQIARVLNSGGQVLDVAPVIADIHRAANAVTRAADRVANGQEGEAV
ncbi:MobC family plasmid mobilization relaxosome protein [Streptomyces sodiiphilus]|uniref:MobC family plasmid mobilization relaxosome protein n=1 Tax=Streptomyces sodiiphilus TaxID=226217 RepID=A0ABN2PYW5_9ACTN